jgi:PAS domain S-box-containing protein
MKKQNKNLTEAALLRQKAEEQLNQRKQETVKIVSEADMLKLIHELEVHQIELEIQNEELVIAKEKAELAEEKYTELYDFAPSGYVALSKEGEILELNFAAANMLGKERSLLINNRFGLFINEDSRGVFANFLEEIFKGKNNAICDVPLRCTDNNCLYVHLTGIISENREQCHLTAIDITERKKAEDDLLKNLAKYQVLIDTFPIAITISDPEGKIIETNEKALELLGLPREEHLKRKLEGEEWKIIKTDGTIFPQDEYASVKALKENRLVENVEMGIVKSGGEITWLNVTAAPIPIEDFGVVIAYNDITERKKAIIALQQIEWMLAGKKIEKWNFVPDYGDLSELNKNGLILNLVGKEQLVQIASEYLDLLETSSAIYEKNGDYALGLFSSSWCQKMDTASRKLCNTENHTEALYCGKWHCHESCWHDASLKAIGSGKPADVECKGGIRLFAVPIHVNGEVIGAINFGYGEPPKTDVELQELSTLFQVPVEELRIASQQYQIRPQYIIDFAKKRIEVSARYIGNLIERKQAEILLQQKSEEIEAQNEELYQANQELIAAREKAENSEERYRGLITNLEAGVVVHAIDTSIILCNSRSSELLGLSEEQMTGKIAIDSSWQFIYEDHRPIPVIDYPVMQVLNSKKALKNQVLGVCRKNNDITWLMVNGFPVFNNNDELLEIVISFIDITRRKQAEQLIQDKSEEIAAQNEELNLANLELIASKEKAEESEARFRKLMENIDTVAVQGYGPGGITQFWNKASEKLYGYTQQEAIGSNLLDLIIPSEMKDGVANAMHEMEVTGEPIHSGELLLKHKDGSPVPVISHHTIVKVPGHAQELFCLDIDISERKILETELKASEERYNLAMKATNDGIFDWNLETNDIYYSPGWKKMLGYADTELPNDFSVWEKTIDAVDLKKSWELQQKLITKQIDRFVMEFKMKHKDGHWVDILARAEAFFNESGKAVRMVGTHTDISERKQAEILIKEYAGRLELTMESANMAWWELDIQTGKVIFNRKKTDMLGYSPEQFNHYSDFTRLVHPDDYEPMMSSMRALLEETADKYAIEYRIKTQSGEYIWFQDIGTISGRTKNGEPLTVSGIVLNITERKLAEELIIHEKLFNEMLIESLPGIFYMFDSDFTPLKWNRNKAELLGLTDEEMKTHNTLDYIATRDKEKLIETFQKTFYEGASHEIIHIINHEGNEFAYHLTGKRLDTAKGPVLLGVGIDITDRLKAENELVTALVKAEESDRLKSAFLANMSHEIRTPMNGILGFADLLKEPGLKGDEQQAYITIIEKSGQRLLNIINNIVDISKIESGLMMLNINKSDINAQIGDIYNFFKPEAEAKMIQLSFNNTLPAEKAIIETDSEKLYAILTNLVKNALKYTHVGSIEFGYKIVETQNIASIQCIACLQFYVKDTGIGIPKNRQEAIFERFIQADISDIMAYQGAGLGLAISKAYVEMLGGKIWVESEAGKGSTFYFTLPYNTEPVKETIDLQPAPTGKIETLRKLKILIVEDDEVSEMLIDSYIKMFGKQILKARTGVETVEICRDNPDIDLILMDIRMPQMGGYEATRQIREFNKEVIIIAQTAYGLTVDREKAIKAGCNDYISKPINKSELLALIQKYFGK